MLKSLTIGIMLLTIFLTEIQSICLKSNVECIQSTDCCSGCCLEKKCADAADTDSCQRDLVKLKAGKGGPCANLERPCKPNTKCVLQQVSVCTSSSCDPVPTCISLDYEENYD